MSQSLIPIFTHCLWSRLYPQSSSRPRGLMSQAQRCPRLPALRPAGEPVAAPTPTGGGIGGIPDKRDSNLTPHGMSEPPASAQHANTTRSENPAAEGWVSIHHSGGEAVHDVQRNVQGLEDDNPLTTPTFAADPSAHADKEQHFDAESPASVRESRRFHQVTRVTGCFASETEPGQTRHRAAQGRGPRKLLGHFPNVL